MAKQNKYQQEFEAYLAKEKHLALMVRSRVKKYSENKVAVRHKPYGEWMSYTWAKFGEMIDATALGMLEFEVKEEELVGIFSNNRVEWAVSDYACFTIRAVSVPIYATNSAKELEYIVNHAELSILFVGNQAQYDKAMSILDDSPFLKKIIVYDKTATIEKSNAVMYFEDFLEIGRSSKLKLELEKRISRLDSEDLSTIIYTSGTTGEPKGVMLTHKAWFAMLFGTGYHLPITEEDVNLAFLPLSHVFERAWSYHILCGNGQVDYCHDTKALSEFLVESRPHYMCSVPRLWEKIYSKVKEDLNSAPAAKQKIFTWGLKIGEQVGHLKTEVKPIPLGLKLKYALAEKLVLSKIQTLFGGRTKVYNCGGAAFSAEISKFFFNTGVLLLQGYGMTECFVISVANPTHNKFGTCGPVVPLMKVRISEEGEIQAKGPSITKGYYKNPELTKESFTEDGYMKTGDIGFIDEDGYITVTDRIKDLMKTSGGKYIAPQMIETLLKEDFYIEDAATIGDNRQYVSALIIPSYEALKNYASKQGIQFSSMEELLKNPDILKFYRDRINTQTKDLGQVEQVKKFALLPSPFTQETGEVTATGKLKRKVVTERYKDFIESMYVS